MTGCDLWKGPTMGRGYGYILRRGVMVLAHRDAYEREFGSIPEGHDIHHVCGEKLCQNPEHMQPVTRSEHTAIQMGWGSGRCKNGHDITDPANVLTMPGRRTCRPCNTERMREHRRRLRGAAQA